MGQEHQQQIGSMEIHASIDRLTILGKTKFKDLFEQSIRNHQTIKKVMNAQWPYHIQYITIDGACIQITGNDAVNIPAIRIDFNPNKLSEDGEKDLRNMMQKLLSTRLSRIDVAIDYIGKDLSQLDWHETRERKRQTIQSANGRLETLYLGAFTSERLTRIYDKGKEQGLDYDWWRVEAQVRMKRGDRIFAENPFLGLYANEKGSEYASLGLEEYATLQYLEQNPTAISKLSKRKKQFYRGLMQSNERKFEPTPCEVFDKEKGNLRQQIATWVKPINLKLPHQL